MKTGFPKCPYCGSETEIRRDALVYGGKSFGSDVLVCIEYPICDAYVGCHKDTGLPKGRLANRYLRGLKIDVHKYFDSLWVSENSYFRGKKGKRISRVQARKKAYRWLANKMEIYSWECHVGWFDIAQCKEALRHLKELFHVEQMEAP